MMRIEGSVSGSGGFSSELREWKRIERDGGFGKRAIRGDGDDIFDLKRENVRTKRFETVSDF